MNVEKDCSEVEKILKKKAADLTEEDKQRLKLFQSEYAPRQKQMSDLMTEASEVVGKEKKVAVSDFAAVRARFKRVLHKTKLAIQEVPIRLSNHA